MAPDFELKDLNGNNVTISEILEDNKPVILSFFGTWCDICVKEIHDFEDIANKEGILVYLIGIDDGKKKIERWAAKHRIIFPILHDPKGKITGKKYDLFRGAFLIIPKMVVISPAGTIEHVSESYSKEKMASLKTALSQIKTKDWNKPVELAIFFTNSINGYLESCNCYKHPYGGFVKFVSWLKRQRAKYSHHILLDSGDFLPHSVSDNSAKFIFKALEITKYDAIALGDQDIYYPGIIEAAKNKKFPFISSNLEWCDFLASTSPYRGKASFATTENGEGNCESIGAFNKVMILNGVKIRIMSFLNSEAFFLYPEEFIGKIKIANLREILKQGKNADFLILLSHSGADYDKKIAQEFDGIDLIIGGHSQTLLNKPIKINQTLIVQAGGNVQHAGKIILKFDKEKKLVNAEYEAVPLVNDVPDDPEIKALIEEQKKEQIEK
ncbi:MAG: redoxin domain-containing protein [Elusimicrobia bacterium]|nr:redoxin domain-containing protein [Elusimicrobiota bacterium]